MGRAKKYGEETVVVRVPASRVAEIKQILSMPPESKYEGADETAKRSAELAEELEIMAKRLYEIRHSSTAMPNYKRTVMGGMVMIERDRDSEITRTRDDEEFPF